MRPGLGNVGSYQVSGYPYITGSAITGSTEFVARFPTVASHVKVQTVGAGGGGHIRVHFNSITGTNVVSGNHWWHVADDQPFEADVKCKELYITHDHGGTVEFRVFAELTNIATGDMFVLTGSGLTD